MNNQKNRIRTRFSSGWTGWMLLFVGLWLCSVSGWSQTQGQELTGKAREKNIERIEKQLKDFYEAWLGACVDEDPAFIEAIGESYVAPNGVFKPDFGKFPEDGLWSFSNYCTNFRILYQSMYEEPLEFRQSDFRFIYLKSVDGGNSVEADFTFQSKLYSGERLITSAEVEAVMLIDAYSPTNYKLKQIAPTQPVTVHYSPEEKKTPKAEVPVVVETPKEERTPVVEMPMEETTPSLTSTVSAKEETFTVNGVSFTMVRVEGGTFRMGATSEQENPDSDEKPVHSVTLSSYSIGQTEVTQALWKAVMGSNPSSFKGDNLPVEKVSWNDCQTFIRKLNALTGRTFRLPTEAEWEFAARGGNQSQGYQFSGSNNLGSVAWYWSNADKKTHPVATKSANELGLYDMSGNVWEWCQDWYGSYSSSSQTNPTGPSSGSIRVNRGGSWGCSARYCRVAYRNDDSDTSFSSGYLGLRLALPDSSPVETPTVVTSASELEGVINGHEYVDLGLSVKWATCNVGASNPSDYGDYFAWGETRPKSEYTDENSVTYKKKIRNIGGKVRYDAARANWGGSWRLPTKDELIELKEKCKWTWTSKDGHKGYKVTGPNGQSIFLPAAGWRDGTSLGSVGEYGYYWSSTPNESDTQYACSLDFNSSYCDWYWYYRYLGRSVRPVSD